jgi:K+-sensing histidine kinase KdpD
VEWEESGTKGIITNLTLGGALISRVKSSPPPGTSATVTMQSEPEQVVFKCTTMSNLMHTTREDIEKSGIYSVGVKFEETEAEVRKKLVPVLQILVSTENSWTKFLKNYLIKNAEQIFAPVILIAVACITIAIPYKLVFLNVFFLVILVADYYLGSRKALMGAILTTLTVVLFAYYFPHIYMPTFSTLDLWMNLLVWASFLVLTGCIMGQLVNRLKAELAKSKQVQRDMDIYAGILEDWVTRLSRRA